MRVLTAKEVNFVSGGSVDGNQYSNPWVLSGDESSSGSSVSCAAPGSQSTTSGSQSTSSCFVSGGFQGTGVPNTSGNSIGDSNYSPPTQEEVC
ncbi:MAG: hypothetical protein P8Q37_02070, partial [Porticoccaceae bacterium]|nr:hypothetical protein [Porticoccaceae bacterium]